MNVTPFLNVVQKDNEATIEIVGEIGYNYWADTYEEYTANTAKNIAAELNAIQALKVDKIKVILDSLGGDVSHALSISNLLRNSGAEVSTYLRGANASASTILACAASSIDNIYMDNMGLYLIHKPMNGVWGNENDMQKNIDDLKKWGSAINQAYLNIGVSQEVIDDLMERNGGHGEWLTFQEAKDYGFVGNEWKVNKVTNYKKEDFTNRELLVPKNIINQNDNKMNTIEEKKSLFAEFKAWFKNEAEAEAAEQEVSDLKAENEALKAENEALKAAKAEQENEELVNAKAENETLKAEKSALELEITNLKKDASDLPKNTKKQEELSNVPTWKKHFNNFKNFAN